MYNVFFNTDIGNFQYDPPSDIVERCEVDNAPRNWIGETSNHVIFKPTTDQWWTSK